MTKHQRPRQPARVTRGTCVHCGAPWDWGHAEFGPYTGDTILCSRCTGWILFDHTAPAGYRGPTPDEAADRYSAERARAVMAEVLSDIADGPMQ